MAQTASISADRLDVICLELWQVLNDCDQRILERILLSVVGQLFVLAAWTENPAIDFKF